MLKIIAAAYALAAVAAASAQTTPTNPDLLSPPISQTTPGGDANASDTGVRALNQATAATPAGGPVSATQSDTTHRGRKGRHAAQPR